MINKEAEASKPTRTRPEKISKQPGKPRKKNAKRRAEAHQRDLDLVAARAVFDPVQRRVLEDSLVRTWIDRELLICEPGLQDMMWVEYRYMSPLERTELFATEYLAAYRRSYAAHCDPAIAERTQATEAVYPCNDLGDMNCLWTARATADRLGVPYDMYLDTVMQGKLGNQKWVKPPQPNQLYASLDAARLRDRPLPAEVAERLYAPHWDARFFANAYRGDPAQEAALALLLSDVWAASDPPSRLSVYLIARRAITEKRARAMFGHDMVNAAIAIGGIPIAPIPSDVIAYQPPCFGYPQWLDTSPCRTCAFVRDCWEQTERVKTALTATGGSSDPRTTAERKQSADRQRKWYDKHRRKPG